MYKYEVHTGHRTRALLNYPLMASARPNTEYILRFVPLRSTSYSHTVVLHTQREVLVRSTPYFVQVERLLRRRQLTTGKVSRLVPETAANQEAKLGPAGSFYMKDLLELLRARKHE